MTAAADDGPVARLIRAGVPVDRIGRLADGTWAYIPPCPDVRLMLHVGMIRPDGTTPVHVDQVPAGGEEPHRPAGHPEG